MNASFTIAALRAEFADVSAKIGRVSAADMAPLARRLREISASISALQHQAEGDGGITSTTKH